MPAWRCPHCGEVLAPDASGYACLNGHRFDRAREGYVNLLPSHHRRSGKAGDDGAMVAARRTFLDAGHYAPLLSEAADLLGAPTSLLDVGCGEGSFTAALPGAKRHGVDISKPAVRAAAKRHRDLRFAVANATRLPYADASFEVVSVFFAPFFPECVRVLEAEGRLLRVAPAAEHLRELRARVFADARPHRRATLSLEGLRVVGEHRVSFDMHLDANARDALVAMTPMEHRSTPAARAALEADRAPMTVRAAFDLDLFERA